MSAVGLVNIVLGVFVVCARSILLIAPAATLRWFNGALMTNGRIRTLGAAFLPLGVAMIWAGSSAESELANILHLLGLGISVGETLGLVMFPAAYRGLASVFVPPEPSGNLIGWRMIGLGGVVVGALFVYFGVLAL